jgi:hypothetical protein
MEGSEGGASLDTGLPGSHDTAINPFTGISNFRAARPAEKVEINSTSLSFAYVLPTSGSGNIQVSSKVLVLVFGPDPHFVSRESIIPNNQPHKARLNSSKYHYWKR